MNKLLVYNLEFPENVNSLQIDDYNFERVDSYPDAVAGLHRLIESSGDEFSLKPTTGAHQLTAMVQLPEKEQPLILPWTQRDKVTRLNDVLYFLTIFTGRNVFALSEEESHLPIMQDPRLHRWGGELRLSGANIGLEEVVNQVLQTISSEDWQAEYEGGYLLFTYRQAIKQENIETVFLLCWTVWEHLFTLANKEWLDGKTIAQMSGDKKIAYIINKYGLAVIDDRARIEIRRITMARNRIVHLGRVPDDVDLEEMAMIVRLTEHIMAIVLDLKPSNVFNSLERLKEVLKGQKIESII